MLSTTSKPVRRKRCSECEELKDDVLGRQKLCFDCEQNMRYCKVCDEWTHSESDGCRHVGWDNEGGHECGCGTDHIEAKDHKESFLLVLRKLRPLKGEMHPDFKSEPLLVPLLRLIEANRFWTCWHGPMIGEPPALALKYTWDNCSTGPYWELCDIPCHVQEKWGRKAINAMQLGMAWLTSLDGKSVEANQLTATWLKEFLAINGKAV